MNEPTPTGKVISVLTVGMDGRKQAIFRMAFKTHTLQRYQLIEDAPGTTPDIAIVDMDVVDARSLWEKFRAAHPDLPAVIATATPSPDAPAPVLAKPIRMETLFPLLRQTLAGQAHPPRQATPAPEAAKPPPAQPPTPSAAQAPAPGPIGAGAGHQLHQLPATIDYFDPRGGLLGVLQEIRRHRTPSVISIGGRPAIIALPNQDSALLLQELSAIRQACDDSATAVSARPLTQADRPQRAIPHSFISLLWQVALWTSRGRLMEGVQPQTPVRLRHWPNLTRLAPIPEAIRIAAFWVRSPVNLRLSVRMLNIPPRHIFDFLAACHSIGVLEIHESGAELAAVPPRPEAPVRAEQKERGGLLSRLLRRVAGM